MKIWQKPQLIVLVRSKPEEAILGACKDMFIGTDPLDTWPGCASYLSPGACGPCSSISSS
jgi:hypothetical protein